ncbi:hypothetical protein OIDMADRAFT_184944 [Oidiodendron maius Zn]|uniref:Fumarylacetoacetase-like C-terminal domain-containing protein n=1 Tax=Oidiodendron maius (strain Zn) TaxID=913774 RepID=A0A0C3GMZ2_OIDMZ|nr:hypothetical protein OIDMADRAFT_184944 [Oidiodendron maius Zn]
MPVATPWSRLIRFVSAHDNQTHFGDAVVPSHDFDIGITANQRELRAKLIRGDPLSANYEVLHDEIVQVKRLLGPLTPLMVPAVRCIGLNYAEHQQETKSPSSRFPVMFPKTPNTIANYGDDVEIPKIAQDNQADYEGELVVVIGRDCKDATQENAMQYVLGYTVADDVSARKWQTDPALVGVKPPPQASFSKSFDKFCPLGPCIVSATLIPDPHVMSLTTKVNGKVRQSSNTSKLIFSIPQLIQFLSQGTTLQAGSILLTGTPSGVGSRMKPPQFLEPGDTVEITIGQVGTLVHGISYQK